MLSFSSQTFHVYGGGGEQRHSTAVPATLARSSSDASMPSHANCSNAGSNLDMIGRPLKPAQQMSPQANDGPVGVTASDSLRPADDASWNNNNTPPTLQAEILQNAHAPDYKVPVHTSTTDTTVIIIIIIIIIIS